MLNYTIDKHNKRVEFEPQGSAIQQQKQSEAPFFDVRIEKRDSNYMDILDFLNERITMITSEMEYSIKCNLEWCSDIISVVVYVLKKIKDWNLVFMTIKIYG